MNGMVNQSRPNAGLRELALFAGVGGGILGGKLLGWRTVCGVEISPYQSASLVARQNDGTFETFPIWDDVCTFDGKPWRGLVDVVSGGFPCQDISAAGKGAGLDGERSGLWSEMARIIGEVRPRYAFIENSPMLVTRGLDRVLCDLAKMGFNVRWGVISAADTGAAHKRDRIWILARNMGNTDNHGQVATEVRKSTSQRSNNRETWEKQTSESTRSSQQYGVLANPMCKQNDKKWEAYQFRWFYMGWSKQTPFSQNRTTSNYCFGGQGSNVANASIERCSKTRELRFGESEEWFSSRSEEMGDSISERCDTQRDDNREHDGNISGSAGQHSQQISDTNSQCSQGQQSSIIDPRERQEPGKRPPRSLNYAFRQWPTEPDVGRVANGVAFRVHRITAIGNGQVPRVVVAAWHLLGGGLI